MMANTNTHTAVSEARLNDLFRIMFTIRRFEETATQLLLEGRMQAGIHSSAGQEAVAAGVCAALLETDLITTNHRGHGHCIAKGVSVSAMMAELMGKVEGTNSGRGGSLHISDAGRGVLGANGIVAAGIPIAVGAAYAALTRNSGQVVASFFGDGAINEGAFHEAMNVAALWKLPVVFVCENNQYAEMTPQRVHSPTKDLWIRAAAYGMPGVGVDGNDVLAVLREAEEAVQRARRGDGPTLIECKTYRTRGHFEGDPEKYKDRDEAGRWAEKDPLQQLRAAIPSFAEIEAEVEVVLREAVHVAEAGHDPARDEATSYVFAE
jgi:TPP-dependent pyruvate/acetoin dehydrogenase alpha subunit